MFVFCFPSDKKAISYKLEFQFQVILPNREGFLDLGDRKTVCISGDQLQGMVIILTLCFYCSFSVYGEKKFAFRRSNFVASKA